MPVIHHAALSSSHKKKVKSIVTRAATSAMGIEHLEDRRMLSAAITLVNPDILPGTDRLIFNYVQNPNTTFPNVVHDQQTLQIMDTGADPLVISSMTLSGPWAFVGAPVGGYTNITVDPGTPLTITLAFTQRSLPAHSVNETDAASNPNGGAAITGSLTISSSASNNPTQTVTLAGYWQSQSENNSEPNLTTITNLLAGYDTVIANPYSLSLPNTGDTMYYGQEVVASSWAAFNPSQSVKMQELSSFRIQGSTDSTYWYAANTQSSHLLLTSVPDQGQTLLPTLANGQLMTASFKPGVTFGFRVNNEYSNDAINTANGENAGASHHFRFYPLVDEHGNAVANSWIVAEDSGDFNYQDNVYVVSNMQPVTAPPAPTNFTATDAANPVLSWNAETYPTLAGYNVYRATSAAGTFTRLTVLAPTSATTFTDTTAPSGTALFYRVTAVDSLTGGESAPATTTANTFTGPTVAALAVNAFTGVAAPINLLAGDTDADGTILPATLTVSTGTNHGGSVTIDPTSGVATYTSTASFVGAETFSYTVRDSNGITSAPAVVTITVTSPITVAPNAEQASATTLLNTPVTINPQVIDSSGTLIVPASILLSATSGGTPAASITTAQGTAIVNPNGTITYTPNANFVGADPFFYEATDSHANISNLAAVGINVGVEINTLVKGGNRTVLYTDRSRTPVNITLNRGIADIFFDGKGAAGTARKGKLTVTGNSMTIHQVALSSTTSASTLSLASNGKGNVTLAGITDAAPLRGISAKTSNLSPDGGIASSGIVNLAGVRSLAFKSVTQGQLTIGAALGGNVSLTVAGSVNTSGLISAVPIAAISVGAWTNTGFTSSSAASSISAPSIGTLVAKGQFEPNLILSGGVKSPTLGSARITGPVAGGTWNINGNVRSVVLSKVTSGWAGASVSGNIGSVAVHTALAADITAGSTNSLVVAGALTGNITTTGNLLFLQAAQLIGSLVDVGSTATSVADASLANLGTATLKSLRLTSKAANTFSDSNVIADNIGSASVGKANTANGGGPEGLAVHTFKTATVTVATGVLHLNASTLLSNAALTAFLTQKGASLGTFAIDILP